jgi:hypothetical protein
MKQAVNTLKSPTFSFVTTSAEATARSGIDR